MTGFFKKHILLLIFLLALCCIAFSGSFVSQAKEVPGQSIWPAIIPKISSINPSSGDVGTTVTITGRNFMFPKSRTYVTFNGVPAISISYLGFTKIICRVPAGATTGKVVVMVNKRASNGVDFNVTGTAIIWKDVNDFAYQLNTYKDDKLDEIGASKFDMVVIDYSKDGTEERKFTPNEISMLKNNPKNPRQPKLVLAYMSIGEAENYRWYWKKEWETNPPLWLGPENPNWEGNYKVKYWYPEWKRIIYGTSYGDNKSYLDKIIDAGFDGVYLDIIDAYEYWEAAQTPRGTPEMEMVAFVKEIAYYARITKGKKNFGVFPQNGEELSRHYDYVKAVTGIGKEDTWYNDNTPQTPEYIANVIKNLDVFKRAGKLVLCIDYVTQKTLIDKFYSYAKAKGYAPYATVRDLNKLTINPGHEPD